MIDNIERCFGRSSIDYMNIRNFKNEDNIVVEEVYRRMLERGKRKVQKKIEQLQEHIKRIEDCEVE